MMNVRDKELVMDLVGVLRRMVPSLQIKLSISEQTLDISDGKEKPVIGFKNGPMFSGKHFAENDIHKQLIHMKSEMLEVEREIYGTVKLSPDDLAKEVIDRQNSCETMLKIIERDYGVDIKKAREWVFNKNVARGYNPGRVDTGPIAGPVPEEIKPDNGLLDFVEVIKKMEHDIFGKIDWDKVNQERKRILSVITTREVEMRRKEFLEHCGCWCQKGKE